MQIHCHTPFLIWEAIAKQTIASHHNHLEVCTDSRKLFRPQHWKDLMFSQLEMLKLPIPDLPIGSWPRIHSNCGQKNYYDKCCSNNTIHSYYYYCCCYGGGFGGVEFGYDSDNDYAGGALFCESYTSTLLSLNFPWWQITTGETIVARYREHPQGDRWVEIRKPVSTIIRFFTYP